MVTAGKRRKQTPSLVEALYQKEEWSSRANPLGSA